MPEGLSEDQPFADGFLHRAMTRRRFLGVSSASLASIATIACSVAPSREAASPGVAPASRSALATVHIGSAGGRVTSTSLVPNAAGGSTAGPITHVPLSVFDHDGNVRPMLAERLPSLDDGTWVANPDGTMRLTWHLRPTARWHDGQPFTSKDVRFSWEFQSDTSLPWEPNAFLRNLSAIDTPDDHTAVMHWGVSDAWAHAVTMSELFIYPTHLLRPAWEAGEGERIFSDDYFQGRFVGLGAYRMEQSNPDSSIVLKPFDTFFLGQPKIGTIVTHEYADSQGLLTALLAGAVHITGGLSLRFEDAVIAQEQWEARGEGRVHFSPVGFLRLLLNPINPVFHDVRIRRALLHAIERDEIVRTLFRGNTMVAHTLLHPNEIGFRAADAAISKYPFHPQRSLALFEEAGWRRGTDGVLANAAGDRFEIPYRVPTSDAEQIRVQGAIVNYWKDVGVRVNIDNVAPNIANDRIERANFPGVAVTDAGTSITSLFRRWHSSNIPREETRFTGDNQARWSNPEVDQVLDQINATLNLYSMEPLLVELARTYSEDLPCLPVYFSTEAVAIHKSVKNARPRPNSGGQNTITWSAYQWEWED